MIFEDVSWYMWYMYILNETASNESFGKLLSKSIIFISFNNVTDRNALLSQFACVASDIW